MVIAEKTDSKSVEIELGCMFVVESVQLMDDYLYLDVAVIMKCKQFAMDFTKICFKHCFREANQVADSLAIFLVADLLIVGRFDPRLCFSSPYK